MTIYDETGNPILPLGVEEFLDGNPSTFIGQFLRTRFGPIVKESGIGAIADDPDDVVVLVNSVPVAVKSVLGLLGIIVLDHAPAYTDTVKVQYNYLNQPRTEFRRLNSVEFILNADGQRACGDQRYLYENVLIDPSIENALGFQGGVSGNDPELLGYFYRGYERAYSISLNDPNLLLLNTPHHKISYPAFSRELLEVLVSYDANILPENHGSYPWLKYGSAITSLVDGKLVIEDGIGDDFPTGKGSYYYRTEDLSFQYSMSFSFRSKITSYILTGDFSGVAAGFLDGRNICLLSFLEDSGQKYLGVLKQGGDETTISSYETVEMDWSDYHIIRLYRTLDLVRVYVDGSVAPVITVNTSDLSDIDELEMPIDFITGTFFGSLSRNSTNTSEWDYLRYLITPDSLSESAHHVNVLYEANRLPMEDPIPWLRLGAFGSENILLNETLLLNKTSATETNSEESHFVSGEIFGYQRFEPFLSVDSVFVADWKFRCHSWTHSISERSVGVFVNDGTKLLAISFFSDQSIPWLSYNGQTVPENDPEKPWVVVGSASTQITDNVLRVVDSSITEGILYSWYDYPGEILDSTKSFIFEFKVCVNSYTKDTNDFVGVIGKAFDGDKDIEILLREDTDRVISFASNGVVKTSIVFDWLGDFHTYRVLVNKDSDLVVLLVDGIVRGSYSYSSFDAGVGDRVLSFGSSSLSEESISDIEWSYFNGYSLRGATNDYVGIYRSGDVTDIDNYEQVPIDFISYHEYRITMDPKGDVGLFIDGNLSISLPYLDLPHISGSFFDIQGGPGSGVYFGSFDDSSMVLSEWDYLRYVITGSNGLQITVPHHQILNQQNVMASPDHIYGLDAHIHTNFSTSSTGLPIPIEEYYDRMLVEDAYTQLNRDTPPVPLTEETTLTKVESFISSLNDPLLVLNDLSFLIQNASKTVELVPNERGMYNTIDMRHKSEGNEDDKIYPALDSGIAALTFEMSDPLCLDYNGSILPEDDGWDLEGIGIYDSYLLGGNLVFQASGVNNRVYRNLDPIFGALHPVEFEVSLRVVQDVSSGSGDTSIRLELCNGKFPIRLGFFSSSQGKYVQIISIDALGDESVVGHIPFNWGDSASHQYRVVLNPYQELIHVYIDDPISPNIEILYSEMIYFLDNFSETSFAFTPKISVDDLGVSEIEIDYIRFCVSRNDSYVIAPEPSNRFFYMNAYEDFVYSSNIAEAKSLMNDTNSVIYAGSKFGEAYPSLSIGSVSDHVDDSYSGALDSVREDDVVLTYTWGGNQMNDVDSTMQNDLVEGFLLNDFTPGLAITPLTINPLMISAVLGADLTINGSNLMVWSLDTNHTVRITGMGAVDLSSVDIIVSGFWDFSAIVIPLSLIPGVVIGSQIMVQVYGSQSNVMTIT